MPNRTGILDQALEMGWRILAERPGRELVAGIVTQPWAADVRFEGMPAEEFLRFGKPGYT